MLFDVLKSVSIEMSEDLSTQFEHELLANQNLEVTVEQLVENVILNHE